MKSCDPHRHFNSLLQLRNLRGRGLVTKPRLELMVVCSEPGALSGTPWEAPQLLPRIALQATPLSSHTEPFHFDLLLF